MPYKGISVKVSVSLKARILTIADEGFRSASITVHLIVSAAIMEAEKAAETKKQPLRKLLEKHLSHPLFHGGLFVQAQLEEFPV